MKRIMNFAAIVAALLISVSLYAQGDQPYSWKASVKQKDGNIYTISVKGTDNKGGWHVYDLGPYDGGPNPTVLTFNLGENARLVGKTKVTSNVHKEYDTIFAMEIGTCEAPVFEQDVEVLAETESTVSVNVEWQACCEGMCIPPDDVDLEIKLPAAQKVAAAASVKPAGEDKAVEDPKTESVPATVVEPVETTAPQTVIAQTEPENNEGSNNGKKSLWGLILSAIGWGFAMLLTPCVFPMVPMTVSFFLKKNQGEKGNGHGKVLASFFGLFIVALYTLPIAILILITYLFGGDSVTADIFNWLATHWLPNVLFFIIFMIFAASFFGAFEITMPSKLVNSSDAKSEKGGLGGVFFLALTLVLVSFSCTGPIVGTVLIESTSGGVWSPIITMLAFSMAFALPFTIFAFAPSLLSKLPKSGGWLNSVKVVLGFIEVALGFKFLSVADQVYHWGLLDREVYLAIWIVVFAMLGFYLLGKLKFKFDSPVEHISVLRLTLSIVVFSFVVYMIPGMWGAPLKALSGYLPPMNTQDFILSAGGGNGGATYSAGESSGETPEDVFGFTPKYSNIIKQPEGFVACFDFNEGLEYAKKVGKPVFVDFTGAGCVNCREMEARVFSDPRVHKLMKEKFVIIQLYGDDKTVVDEADWIVENGKTFKTIGKINTYRMNKDYNVNAQPYYVLIDSNDGSTIATRAYDLDIEGFIAFLNKAIK